MSDKIHMLVKTQTIYEKFDLYDPAHPSAEMPGECFGSFEIKASCATGGGCVYTDDAGNVSALRFTVTGMTPQGAVTGT